MSSLSERTGIILAMGLLLMAAACSDPNNSGQFNPGTGRHGAGWLPAGHAQAASAETTTNPSGVSCAGCHGPDLRGGISGVSCTGCHLGGPFAVHPAAWTITVLDHGPTTLQTGTAACANQYCHGPALAGVVSSGPSCTTCHSIPFNVATIVCGSCHQIPPAGTISPNIAGKHAQHKALGTYITCGTCHQGSDGASGALLHFNRVVEVAFDPAYAAKSGGTPTFSSSAATCSNISCHGGRVTPNWLSGTLNVNTQCASCHQLGTALGSPQYNSYYSGLHDFHINQRQLVCVSCHDTVKLAVNHFTTLNTTAMEGPASATLLNALNYAPGASPGTGTCSPPCHGT
ncbi:MAG TPA: CxxxxCH/CxxCH domain-containing protein, partial [Nitrospirota bacterium]